MSEKVTAFLKERKKKTSSKSAEATDENLAKAEALEKAMQPHQRRLYLSKSDHDAVLAPRQTGKSWGTILLVFANCFSKPNSQWAIIGPTLKALIRIYIVAFRVINRKFELGVIFNKSDYIFNFPNGSVVYLVGADDLADVEKLRGPAFDGVIVDESQSFNLSDFTYLLEDILEACILARRGRIIIIGTPGPVLKGEFYLATSTPPALRETDDGFGPPGNYAYGEEPGEALWCKHCWNSSVNEAAPHIREKALAFKLKKGWSDTHPKWLREYEGQWVASDETKVYRYVKSVNSYDGKLPELPHGHSWRKTLGVDLGAVDGTAMVVWAYSSGSPNLYEVYSHKEVKTDLQPINTKFIATWRNKLAELYGPFDYEVCDPGGLADIILESLSDDYQVWFDKAEVTKKEDHIELFNTDLDDKRIFVIEGSPLEVDLIADQWKKDPKTKTVPPKGKRREDSAIPNDVADAGLYGFRACQHRRYNPDIPEKVPTEQERIMKEEKEAIMRLILQRTRELEDPCSTLN